MDSASIAPTAQSVTPILVERAFNTSLQYTDCLGSNVKTSMTGHLLLVPPADVSQTVPRASLLFAYLAIVMVGSSTGRAAVHVQAYTGHDHVDDHVDHDHGPATHDHDRPGYSP